ncbi:hypothetical protein PCANC_12774 [Puccinia coronata f. sp. avenae]|uniref:Uncharacterized protein n=1 Tax=Puccinia coronata f. sp. avenae TaxID=200324 RepID=A0A2N5T4G3_9BASI|nr:hypothetical protein PCANC_12774 [Puccinia coronata f. sp. avenae]
MQVFTHRTDCSILLNQLPSRPVTSSVGEQVNGLLGELSLRAGQWPARRAQFAMQVTGLLGELSSRAGHWPARELSSPSRPLTCSQTELAKQAIDLLAN